MNAVCLAGMFLIWTAMFGVALAAVLRTFGLPWSLGLTAALPPAVGLSLGLVALLSKALRCLCAPKREERPFTDLS